jgi:hypothetical protein
MLFKMKMPTLTRTRYLRILALLAILELLLPGINIACYRLGTRPALLRSGALDCRKYQSPFDLGSYAAQAIEGCDVVLPKRVESGAVETYYGRTGWRSTLRFAGGSLTKIDQTGLPVPLLVAPFAVGFLLIFAGGIHKMSRTGEAYRTPWKRAAASTEGEALLFTFGIVICLTSFITVLVNEKIFLK